MSDAKKIVQSVMKSLEVVCTLTNCRKKTSTPYNVDPRKRWVTGLKLRDPGFDGCLACDAEAMGGPFDLTHTCTFVEVNLCPGCAQQLLGTTEADYVRLEKAEQIAAGKRPVTELIQ